MQRRERGPVHENSEGFVTSCLMVFDRKIVEEGTLKLFEVLGENSQKRRGGFVDLVHRYGLQPKVELKSGESKICVDLPREVNGVKRVEYYVKREN